MARILLTASLTATAAAYFLLFTSSSLATALPAAIPDRRSSGQSRRCRRRAVLAQAAHFSGLATTASLITLSAAALTFLLVPPMPEQAEILR